jgi:enterobactin synthetase component D
LSSGDNMLTNLFKLESAVNINSNFVHSIKHWTHSTQFIQLVSCNFETEQYNTKLFSELSIYYPDEIKRAVHKRQAEFLIGRFTARYALLYADFEEENLPTIQIGIHRSPIWPKKIIGSITHNSSQAVCVLAKKIDIDYLGIDIESILSDETASEIASEVLKNNELSLLLDSGISFNEAVTLIFSAKESIFKALYPKVKHYFGFECARLVNLDRERCTLTFELDRDLSLKTGISENLKCYFEQIDDSIITLIY